MKNLKYIFIFFFLLSCGYTPIYQTDQNSKIRLDMINYSGDKKLGRSITKGIERLKNKNNDKTFSKKFFKESTYNSMNNKFELNQYKLTEEKNMISQILQDINIYLNIIRNDL